MSGPIKIVTEAAQSFSFSRRATMLGFMQAGVGVLLASRMAWIAVAENERYELLAESNRVNLTLLPPRRGWIVDRAGTPIANNRTDFRIDLIPERLTDAEGTLGKLSQLLALDTEALNRIRRDLQNARGFTPVPVAENLDWDRYASVVVRQPELPGVAPTQGYARNYPSGAAVAHLVGYVGGATADQYKETKDPLFLTPGFKLGKDGLEKALESTLRGAPGAKRVEVTARGRPVRDLETRRDVPGKTVRLTIDAGLQEYAARRLGNESGTVVVIDTLDGSILTMASMPAYDPNSFSDGISQIEWGMMSSDDHLPLTNKALQGLYPPGSTFKPATALAALRSGIDPDRTVYCGGGYQLGNRFFRCLGRHGSVNLHRAIARSCNTYFYTMGREVGMDAVAAAARELGLGAEYPLPFPSQRYGTIPDPAWKLRKYDQKWTPSDTLNAAIGQGYILTSPLQLAVQTSRIASGRRLVPRILADTPIVAPMLDVPPERMELIRSGMDEVVNGAGTAVRSRLQLDGIRMGGKTGTAQVRRIAGGARGGMNVPWKYRDHGLFIGFAPVEQPRYAVSVVIEHGMSGSGAAAPVARDVLTYLFDRQRALDSLAVLEENWGGDIRTRMAVKADAYRAARANPAPVDPAADTATPPSGNTE
ncbi:penicillin-binding protein 2 [Sphingomonas qomolangmaensis]|uniref:Penicillin-binding protein 2 n=1 Tax=Sphingomonas qomolangmaensis TaxID=2918765 RepID=A0ABY5LC60_9SPHN|nr:penicillin-binding protein 2 [Sphingomonas qomolangmaensis]UUL83389.1 penicillin-binding protein 2 [Sphingomonas qomolangmaensis]